MIIHKLMKSPVYDEYSYQVEHWNSDKAPEKVESAR